MLATVFAVAGIAKLADRAGSRTSMRAFGLPAALAPIAALLMPIAELACAVALLFPLTMEWGALGALALLTMFAAAIGGNMLAGRHPDCHCFGQLHSKPAGWSTLLRNVALGAIAVVVAWPPASMQRNIVGPVGGLDLTTTLALIAITQAVLGAWLFYQVLRQNGRMLLRLDAIEAKLGMTAQQPATLKGLPVDSSAQDFRLSRLEGGTVTLASLWSDGKPVMLVFGEPNCAACDELLPDLAKWQHDHAHDVVVVPVSSGGLEANRVKARAHALQHVLVQRDREVADAYRVEHTPSAVLVTSGRVASALAIGPDAIRALMKQATMPPPLKRGDRVPSLRLRDANGGTSDLAVLGGQSTLLLFWNPACGFCQAMLDDVKAWERDRGPDAPELVVVSMGSPKTNREQGFRSRVLLDPAFNAGARFGAEGTPAAVLIDEEGRVASEVGVGAPAVLSMAGAVPEAVHTH